MAQMKCLDDNNTITIDNGSDASYCINYITEGTGDDQRTSGSVDIRMIEVKGRVSLTAATDSFPDFIEEMIVPCSTVRILILNWYGAGANSYFSPEMHVDQAFQNDNDVFSFPNFQNRELYQVLFDRTIHLDRYESIVDELGVVTSVWNKTIEGFHFCTNITQPIISTYAVDNDMVSGAICIYFLSDLDIEFELKPYRRHTVQWTNRVYFIDG